MSPTNAYELSQDQVTDAVVAASRALVGLAMRSLATTAPDLTMVQHRALVVLAYQGDRRVSDLATDLGVNSSTVTRLITRLGRKRLVERAPEPGDRRVTRVSITPAGRAIVAAVRRQRRTEIARILRRLPDHTDPRVVLWLNAFTVAAGEAEEQSWTLGWTK